MAGLVNHIEAEITAETRQIAHPFVAGSTKPNSKPNDEPNAQNNWNSSIHHSVTPRIREIRRFFAGREYKCIYYSVKRLSVAALRVRTRWACSKSPSENLGTSRENREERASTFSGFSQCRASFFRGPSKASCGVHISICIYFFRRKTCFV